jgi:hypothetical protein
VPASLVLNGKVIAFAENEANVVATGNIAAWATTNSRDAMVVLRRGCHSLEVLFQDPSEGTKLSFGEEVMVCSVGFRTKHAQIFIKIAVGETSLVWMSMRIPLTYKCRELTG